MNVQLPGASETAASFEFEDEDHTLGNALRYMIMRKYVIGWSDGESMLGKIADDLCTVRK